MSVNVDFDIRVSGTDFKVKAGDVEELLEGEGLLGEMTKKVGKEDVRFTSGFPIIISKSYVYLPELTKRLKALATGGLVIEMRTRTDSKKASDWMIETMPKTKAKAAPKTKTKAKAELPVPKERASTKLSVHGKTVVLTGTVTGMERKDAEAKLTGLGARCTSSVSKKTDYVFAMADAGSKKTDAERLGIPVLNETVLFSLIGLPGKPKAPKKPVTTELKEKVAERKPDEDEGFSGKTVVITGTLSQGRSEIAAILEEAGAKVAGSVSANTHYLITGAGVGASKLTKATALGVTIIDEAKMNEMLGG